MKYLKMIGLAACGRGPDGDHRGRHGLGDRVLSQHIDILRRKVGERHGTPLHCKARRGWHLEDHRGRYFCEMPGRGTQRGNHQCG